jgi:hypothetical protein
MFAGNLRLSGFCLITGSPADTTMHMRRLLVRLAVRSPIQWLTCGNYYDLQRLIYDVALRAGKNYYNVLENNIGICRAETCYQVVALLCKTKAAETPILISDLLMHFYDENVRADEAKELFIDGMQALKKLSRKGLVIVSAFDNSKRSQFFAELRQNAGRVIQFRGDHYGS